MVVPQLVILAATSLLSLSGPVQAQSCPSGKPIVFSDNKKACLDDYPVLRDLPVQVRGKEVSFAKAFDDPTGYLAVSGSRCGGMGTFWIPIPPFKGFTGAVADTRGAAVDSANNGAIQACKANQKRIGTDCDCELIVNANSLSTLFVALYSTRDDLPSLLGLGSSASAKPAVSSSGEGSSSREAQALASERARFEAERQALERARQASAKEDGERQREKARLETEKQALEILKSESQRQANSLRAERERLEKERATLAEALLASGKGFDDKNLSISKRALVIGNDSYVVLPKLKNGREDARAVADLFSKLGYTVSLRLDLSMKQMQFEFRNFKRSGSAGDEIVIFFAGHGVQISGINYLLPIDSAAQNEDEVRDDSMSLQRIVDDAVESKARLALFILDACRDNPFKVPGRSIGGARGLAAASPATGQMIVFSAGVGQQALDNLGPRDTEKGSVFTRTLVKEALRRDLTVDQVIRNVRREVVRLAKSIGHDQVPAVYDQLVGDYRLAR